MLRLLKDYVLRYINYPKVGSILRNEYKYLREDPVIAKAICMMYPSETMYSDIVKYDAGLAMKLISEPKNNDIYRLDNISYFGNNLDSNLLIQKEVIRILYNEIYSILSIVLSIRIVIF